MFAHPLCQFGVELLRCPNEDFGADLCCNVRVDLDLRSSYLICCLDHVLFDLTLQCCCYSPVHLDLTDLCLH